MSAPRSLASARALAEAMLGAALGAAEIVNRIYHEADRGVTFKVGDDPVTRADHEANAFLLDALGRIAPGVVLVAEESDPASYAGYAEADAAFFIDPLDGTREFVAKNGEFCVMVGFAEAGRATVGVVACPSWAEAFLGASLGEGAERGFAERALPGGRREPIHVSSTESLGDARGLISRSHKSAATDAVLARLGAKELVPYGSAGLKALQVATGAFDFYAHPGPSGMLWDSCAPEAIVRGAGGLLTDAAGVAIDYRRPTLANERGVLAAGLALHGRGVEVLAPFVPGASPSRACRSAPS
ncbi:MAG: 3'(2'),5'-bisphosphate nucleotidase CysQ [Myxococcales bacterium]|nr:3'(2'),5'-bisphosphate nucleotidase CysQ [Myxococcales bacterium]MBL0196568.1 3'(2'),5'-bisphosphate nucleotidase CysQ [Myxococcales bacterium]